MTPDLGDKPDDQAVLQYAMGREHLAMSHYRALADSTAPGPIKAISVKKYTAWLVFSPAFGVAAAGTKRDYAPAAAP